MDGYKGRVRLGLVWWMDCVKDEMSKKRVNIKMTAEWVEWKKKTCCAYIIEVGYG